MTYAELTLPEFDQEMVNTRKVLERVPDDKLDWRATPKTNTIGWNANHLAEMVGWVEGTFAADSWDMHPVGGEPYRTPELASRQAILESFDKNVAAARRSLEAAKDANLDTPWSLLQGGEPIVTLPRFMVFRMFVLNHIVHHRAHLLAYLRLCDIPVPGMYGPSGDEA